MRLGIFLIALGMSLYGAAYAEDGVLYDWGNKADEGVMSPVAEKNPARISTIRNHFFVCLSSSVLTDIYISSWTGGDEGGYVEFIDEPAPQ